MATRANKDTLTAIWVLAKLGWSNRRIAKLKLPTSHHTITAYWETACELLEEGKLPITAMDEKAMRIRYCGGSSDIERIDGVRNSGLCGGGRRVKTHKSSNTDGSDKE